MDQFSNFDENNLSSSDAPQAPAPETDAFRQEPEMPPQASDYNPQQPQANPEQPRRRESPYASSPYVMSRPDEYVYHPQPSVPREKQQGESGKSDGHVWKTLVAAVLIIALVAVGCGITANYVTGQIESRNAETVDQLSRQIQELQGQIKSMQPISSGVITQQLPDGSGAMIPSQLYSQSVDSVVAISTTVTQNNFYGSSTGTASGSGFILTADGYIVTNHHVVDGAIEVTVTTHDGTEYTATVTGSDSTNDIAVLKIDAEDLPAATVGSSSTMLIGDMVVAIGNPLGELSATQTVGYVSGINREVTTDNTIINMIQTDAAINPGNSGGPLFNMYGQVVGITTAKYSGTTGSGASIEGIGFAIPIDDVLPIISDLIEYGHVTGAYLGVSVQNTDADSAAMFGLPTGAYVVEVVEGGSADRAGIQPKDLIIRLADIKVSNITDLTRALRKFKAGDVTTITLIRGGKEMTLEVVLDEKPAPQEPTDIPEPDENMPSEGDYDEWFKWFFGSTPKAAPQP